MKEKPVLTAAEAVRCVRDGMTVMVGGFLGCGSPCGLLAALDAQGTRNMRLVCNDTALCSADRSVVSGVAPLVVGRRFSRIVTSHIGTNRETGRQMEAGETPVELVPQGTLAERIRAAGAGLGGVLTPTGVGTEVEEGKQVLEVEGKKYLLELPLFADVALLKARRADRAGNLVYAKAARNFNPLMAMAAGTVIVEADEIVEIGEIDPDTVMTPSLFVHILVRSGS